MLTLEHTNTNHLLTQFRSFLSYSRADGSWPKSAHRLWPGRLSWLGLQALLLLQLRYWVSLLDLTFSLPRLIPRRHLKMTDKCAKFEIIEALPLLLLCSVAWACQRISMKMHNTESRFRPANILFAGAYVHLSARSEGVNIQYWK